MTERRGSKVTDPEPLPDGLLEITSTGDEEADFDAIEAAAVPYTDGGWEPTDSEPGEWLVLTSPHGSEVEIRIVPGPR